MKEGRLSSGLMKRYGIAEEHALGKVLWHSLNESGEISHYDMKFGDTIVRNLMAEDVTGEGKGHARDDEHGVQDSDDPKRKDKGLQLKAPTKSQHSRMKRVAKQGKSGLDIPKHQR